MAEVAGEEGAAAFWSRDASDEEQPLVYITGLSSDHNLRRAPKFQRVKAEGRKAGGHLPVSSMDLPPAWLQHRDHQEDQGDAGNRSSASLKDLCPEDKRRIANLIKELARVSEEKEVTEERLKNEHQSFEKKIRHLEEQNNLIATEREALQQQYRECQEMLSLYQKYLSEQQDKLNRSLSDLGARSAKPQQVPKIQQQPTESELNGSYIAQCHKASSSDVESVSSFPLHPTCRSDHPLRCGPHCRHDRCCSENGGWRKCCGTELHYPDMTQGHHCGSTLHPPVAHCCFHHAPHSTPGRGPPELPPTRPPEVGPFPRHSALNNGVATRVKDSAASERRKHELLLQKMELEVERERLQQLLDQQEAKLLEKQQELLQSRLEPDRSVAPIHTREAAVGTTPSLGTFQLSNGTALSPVRGSPLGLPTPPSSKNCKKQCSPRGGGAHSGRRAPDLHTDHPRDKLLSNTSYKGSCKNAATSPSVASQSLETNSAKMSPDHKEVFRYETSLIDMLEAISPISFQKRHRLPTDPFDLSLVSPPPRDRRPKPSRQKPPAVDPEESRILEDIFFIC